MRGSYAFQYGWDGGCHDLYGTRQGSLIISGGGAPARWHTPRRLRLASAINCLARTHETPLRPSAMRSWSGKLLGRRCSGHTIKRLAVLCTRNSAGEHVVFANRQKLSTSHSPSPKP